MNTYYEQWLAREEAWGRHLDERQKKKLYQYLLATPVVSIAALFALGFVAGGGMELAVNNMKYGAIFGFGVDVLLLLISLPGMPGKRYKKQLSKVMDRELSSHEEREEFAAQMMGKYGADTVECISWTDKMMGDENVWVSKDYILRTTGTGNADLIQLKQVESIELDARTYTQTAGSGNAKVRYNSTDYPIIFKSFRDGSKPSGWKEKLLGGDPQMVFQSRDARDRVVQAIQRLTSK